MIDLLIKHIKVYTNKIEITFNYTKTEEENNDNQLFTLFTENITKKRRVKGSSNNKYTQKKDILILI